ncbi:exonuclease domain-containing protein [Allokutzneria sp. A3M-2-11 16]|uniref:3'-5' exonuclease n=1 Tax=Allokutzneria sp. A3M-2-11 16 TaxID=2962043 RepID=UPI0020B7A1D7|nr:exonuclease domain-containing protein [Allokutzneria sp. A3M-2-11 16]MCP3802019.1 exonuclease domain-containing protein [Allokutzneria sp. A3M-2-11 16]
MLVDPERSMGASWVHGLTSADVEGTPRFGEIAHPIAEQLEGTILVAHNLPFDVRFLEAEFERAGLSLPADTGVCALEVDRLLRNTLMSRSIRPVVV